MRHIILPLLCIALAGCTAGSVNRPAPIALHIAGSTTLQPVLEDLAAAYQATHPHVLVEVRGGGTAVGVLQLQNGRADLAAVSWQAENETLPAHVRAIPIARDGIAIIVHPTNTLTNLTSLQLRALYRGEILDWDALGAARMPLVISREEGSGTRAAFEALVMGDERVTLNALVLPTSRAVVDYVASHRDAIGYVSTGAVTDRVRVVAVEEVAPDPAALRAGAYPLGRVLYLFAGSARAEAQAFLDFALSSQGQAIVARRLIPVR